jgi:hypothetical protein
MRLLRLAGTARVTSNDEGSQEPFFRQADGLTAGDDDVIQDTDVDQTQGVLQSLRDEFRLRWFCYPARVRVGQDHGRGVLLQGLLYDLTWVNRRSVDRALEHFLIADEPVPLIKITANTSRARFPSLRLK